MPFPELFRIEPKMPLQGAFLNFRKTLKELLAFKCRHVIIEHALRVGSLAQQHSQHEHLRLLYPINEIEVFMNLGFCHGVFLDNYSCAAATQNGARTPGVPCQQRFVSPVVESNLQALPFASITSW